MVWPYVLAPILFGGLRLSLGRLIAYLLLPVPEHVRAQRCKCRFRDPAVRAQPLEQALPCPRRLAADLSRFLGGQDPFGDHDLDCEPLVSLFNHLP